MAYNPFRHLGLKVIAVGVAALLWVAVGGEKVVERSVRAPLETQNKPEGIEQVGDMPGSVDVRVRGSSAILGQLSPGDVVAVLDLSTARPGRRLFHLAPDHVRVPFGVEVTYVGPATLPLTFERSATRVVPVVPSVEGEAAPGFSVERISVDPETVEIVGPESVVRDVKQAATEPVALDGSAVSIRETVTIGLPNSAARLRIPQVARILVEIAPVRTERKIDSVPVRMQNLRNGLSAYSTPSSLSVTFRGSEAALKGLTVDAIMATVDLNGLGAGVYPLPVRIAAAKTFGVARVDPPQVRITIR